jgi:hypothetical protein
MQEEDSRLRHGSFAYRKKAPRGRSAGIPAHRGVGNISCITLSCSPPSSRFTASNTSSGTSLQQSITNDFSDADYGQPNSDDFEFRYPQDLYPPSDLFMDLDDILSNDGSQRIDNHVVQIEPRPETPDNAQQHEEYWRGPQIQSPGNSPSPSPSLSSSSNPVTDETEELELATV